MKKYPHTFITQEMLDAAEELLPKVKVKRTITSKIDTLIGILGEFVFAKYLFGDWKMHNVGNNKGQEDFKNVEVKASAYPFSEYLNLLVREDYAKKRKPKFYVQIIIDVPNKRAEKIEANTKAIIAGWASSADIEKAPKRDFGSKFTAYGKGGYKCHYISIKNLFSMGIFKQAYEKFSK